MKLQFSFNPQSWFLKVDYIIHLGGKKTFYGTEHFECEAWSVQDIVKAICMSKAPEPKILNVRLNTDAIMPFPGIILFQTLPGDFKGSALYLVSVDGTASSC